MRGGAVKKLDNSLKVFLSVMFFSFSLYDISHAEYVADEGSAMLYIEPLQDLPDSTVPTGWTALDYDITQDEGKGDDGTGCACTGWQTGTYGVGYGDDDDNTVITTGGGVYSVYTRAEFKVTDVTEVVSMGLKVVYDDGFVAWLNGVEVARGNFGGWVGELTWDAVPSGTYDPQTYEADITAFIGQLVNGRNVLAIGIWNRAPNSSDLSLIPQLNLSYSTSTSPVLTRYPYIQKAYSDSVAIVWDTDIATSNNMVEYGLTQNYGSVAYDSALGSQHIVTLTGLDPATRYYYRISSGGTVLTASGTTFQTNQDETDPVYTFVVLGDSGKASPGQSEVAQLIEDIFPDLLLHTGDVVYERNPTDTPATYATYYNPRYFVPYKDTIRRVPLYPTLGNHDIRTDSGAAYLDAFILPDVESGSGTESYYSFDYTNAHFISLDVESSLYSPGTPQHTWLEADLSATPDNKWKFVFFHKPAYSGNTKGDDHSSNPKIQEYLSPLFDAYGVHIVFSGHSHNYERTKPIKYNTLLGTGYISPDGVTYVVTGGGGGNLKDDVIPNWWTATYLDHAYHVTKLSINGDYLALKAVKADGGVFDSYTIVRNTFIHELIPPLDTTVAPGEMLGPIREMRVDISTAGYQFYLQPYAIRPDGATIWLWSSPKLITVPPGGIISPIYSLPIPGFSKEGTFYYGIRLTDLDGELIDDKSFAFTVISGGAITSEGPDISLGENWKIDGKDIW
jgi:hypothetical protein